MVLPPALSLTPSTLLNRIEKALPHTPKKNHKKHVRFESCIYCIYLYLLLLNASDQKTSEMSAFIDVLTFVDPFISSGSNKGSL